ncbi:MAG: hemin uptake protein HemP [Gammaproteobacteria bacterium]
MDKKVTPAPPVNKSDQQALNADELFAQRKEVAVHYRGEVYRLRLTRNDKLILTK